AEPLTYRSTAFVARGNEPSTGAIRIACDDHFVVWVNGKRIGEGDAQKPYRFNLNGIVETGPNVIAVEATNKEGRAGLFVDGEIRGQSGGKISFDSSKDWKVSLQKPTADWLQAKYDDAAWKPVKVLAGHQDSPWKELAFAGSYLDRFEVAPGFELKRIAEPELVGSLVAISWGNRGRLLASREGGPILNLIDENQDGTYDKVTEFSDKIKSCQGLCQVGDLLYAVGDGPQGAGVYRLTDANHDDQADSVELLMNTKGGMGEHGPHDVVFGPDGSLYHNLGNHAWITASPEATTPCRNYIEGNLLTPPFEDANGHAVGIKAPGGTIWRFSPDGKRWWLETMGFRNQYDIAFNSKGDLFTFDSDMEWDVNLPWYRPVRINHCIPGAEFGWRSGAANWPDYFFDSLPGTIDIGRGSPTGVLFYEHSHFPEKYRGAMLNCDWSMGRLIVSYFKKEGASYTGTYDNLVTGNPLNISDVEVDRDGTVVFSTGGRNTEGGVYRVTFTGEKPVPTTSPQTTDEILAVPQGQSAWARELIAQGQTALGTDWEAKILEKVATGTPAQKTRGLSILAQSGKLPSVQTLQKVTEDGDAGVRAFATWLLGQHATPDVGPILEKLLEDTDLTVQRRACEAFVRSGVEAPVAPLLKLLASPDRWLRFAARLTLERVPLDKWKTEGLASKTSSDVVFNVILALLRTDPQRTTVEEIDNVIKKSGFKSSTVNDEVRARQGRDMLRLAELTALTYPEEWLAKTGKSLGKELSRLIRQKHTPEGKLPPVVAALLKDEFVLHEAARLVAYAQAPDAPENLLGLMGKTTDTISQIHYALCLRYAKEGWTPDAKQRLLKWYESTRELEGGHSLQGYLRNIVGGTLDYFTPEDRAAYLTEWKQWPHAAKLILSQSQPDQIKDFDAIVNKLLQDVETTPGPAVQEIATATIDSLIKSTQPAAQVTLRRLFDQQADRRDQLARGLAAHPSLDNAAYYLRGIQSGDGTTAQQCLQALEKSGFNTEKAEDYRTVIMAGLKLGTSGGAVAVNLLKQWTSSEPKSKDVLQALADYQAWYAERFPSAPAAVLAQEDLEKSKFSLQQLIDIVDKGPAGDVTRGKAVFAKANCIKCHQFLKEGEGIGPDLTTLRRRFQKKEILESVLFPSQVMSDQYRTVTITTTEGLVYNGMPIPTPGNTRQIVLLLSDATKVVIQKDKIEEQAPAKVSVMPEGLFKTLTEQEIADLFAFLETSRSNPEPTPVAKSQ
ncbi:MAG: HEAT repeat domain-containing protein, partial [Planctomycetota bacterium]